MPPKKTWSPSKRFYLYLTAFVLIVITVDTYQKTVQVTQRKGQIAIIDPLSRSDETGFTEQCRSLFLSEGYEVDITKGAEVTVDKLKQIPKDYETLILRVHSGLFDDSVWFFTSERYDATTHVLEQINGDLHIARTSPESDLVFAVGAQFIMKHFKNRLQDTLVILMGCNGLSTNDLGDSFLRCGARAYISWDGPITLEHTDKTSLLLIEKLLGGETIENAVHISCNTTKPENIYYSRLLYIYE